MEQNKYPIGGYAPGYYYCKCCDCGQQFFGDKRAVQCEPCATKTSSITMEQYNPVMCEHKLPTGLSAWQFQSEEQSNLGGANKVIIHVCVLCGEISIGGYRPSKDETHTNSFHETFNICHPDAIDAIIKQANFYNEEVKWTRVTQPPSTTQGAVSEDAHEKEIMIKAFDKVQKIFKMREWVMEGRGSYPYNDDRYKEEVRYLFDEFEAIRKDTWENIESKSFEYRERIIANYLKEHPAKGAVWVKAVNLNEILIGKEYFYKFYNGKADEHRGIGNFNNINEFVPFDEYANVRREDFYYLEILDETGSQRQAGPGWVNCQDRMPEIDSSSDDPLKYILEFKIDGGRGMTDVDYVTAEEMRESVKLYDYCRWLDESQSTPSKEVDAVELLIWMIENGYIVTEEGEIWQKPNNALFTPEKLIELYQKNK
jgi:hypothetical protein